MQAEEPASFPRFCCSQWRHVRISGLNAGSDLFLRQRAHARHPFLTSSAVNPRFEAFPDSRFCRGAHFENTGILGVEGTVELGDACTVPSAACWGRLGSEID